jgi:EmrB/QacA subfamily drug resistance transporter
MRAGMVRDVIEPFGLVLVLPRTEALGTKERLSMSYNSDQAAPDPRRWLALCILLIANFMNMMDVTIVNVALPAMREKLGATDAQIEWVAAAYVLAFALGLLPFGRIGDIWGRTHMFLAGVAAFTAASALCGMANSIEMLIFARVLQGLGGALMTPQVLAIASVAFPPHERGQAFSLFGLTAGLASVSGPVLGGFLIHAQIFGLDWQPIFLVNIPFGILTLIAGWFLIPRLPGQKSMQLDWAGVAIFGLAIVSIVFAIIEGQPLGWPSWIFALLAFGLVLLGVFYLWQRSRAKAGKSQLLNYDLLRNRDYMFGALVMTLYASGIPGMFLVISLALQTGYGFTPLESGLATMPFSIGVLIASFVTRWLKSFFLRERLAAAGALLAVGTLVLHYLFVSAGPTMNPWLMTAPLLVSGIGLGTGFAALFQLVLANVPPRDAGAGSGALQAFQQVGGALGIALAGQIFFGDLAEKLAKGVMPEIAFSTAAGIAFWYQVAIFASVMVMAFAFKKPAPPPAAGPSEPPAPIEA